MMRLLGFTEQDDGYARGENVAMPSLARFRAHDDDEMMMMTMMPPREMAITR